MFTSQVVELLSNLDALVGGNTEDALLFFCDEQVEDGGGVPSQHSCRFACHVRVPHAHDAVHTCTVASQHVRHICEIIGAREGGRTSGDNDVLSFAEVEALDSFVDLEDDLVVGESVFGLEPGC